MRLILFLVSLFYLLAGGRIDSFAGQTNRIGHANFLLSVNNAAVISVGVESRSPVASLSQVAGRSHVASLSPVATLLTEIATNLTSVVATSIPEHKRIDICEDSETEDDREVFARKLKIISSFLISDFTPVATNLSQYYRSSPTASYAAPIYLLLGVLRL